MGHAYGFFWRCRAINDIAHLTSYRDAIGVPCIRALVVNPQKCVPGQSSLEFLGHYVTSSGVKVKYRVAYFFSLNSL